MKTYKPGLSKGIAAGIMCLTLCLFACKSTFDIEPENVLSSENAYQNVYDADAVVMGIYGKVQGLAERYMVLNELRGDLEDVTPNSDKYLKQLNDHAVTTDNSWADPRPWYEVIINCNDALANFSKMLSDKRLSQADYNIRYSEVGAIRTWLYLQAGVQYGTIPYITDPLAKVTDLDDASRYPMIGFDDLLTRLIDFTMALPNKDPMPAGTSLVTTLDTYNTTKMFINKYCLMGDLYLWKGNYTQAAHYYKIIMNYADVLYPTLIDAGENWTNTYKLGNASTRLSAGNWMVIFASSFGERYSNYEIIWNLPFDKKFAPENPFIDLFYSRYLVKPSAQAIKNWNSQTRSDNTPGDTFRGVGRSYTQGTPIIAKMLGSYNPALPFETSGKWILCRAAMIHLRMSEAANRDGFDRIAYGFMNNGIRSAFTPAALPVPDNVSNIMQTTLDTKSDYYFDARQGEFPRYRSAWYVNEGIRGRASLAPAKVDSAKFFNMTIPGQENKPVTDRPGLTIAMEDLLVNEAALELAFEGNRWQDLVRIALRREKITAGAGRAFLRDKVAAKFTAAGLPVPAGVTALGTDVKNWYLPFKMK
ncbi:RagB/SusD family nutrient uptake outer membrane protein [Hufsiella ginkgonis]|uniref:RagB/SusD family nutrient uptake outer membrane protein n=1 Tax=Hufsiella ginkgonis TaxID=2695274 RepID=A0A7K1Y382_9SPHI|nr:RagB/SusD family nutrient uptake outer membrane protein [Hufsiella ginkgonis]MXV17337.1 RagB/SusD family nutrient uptake outer membrane protein [Hufsiella ginkgonis]